MCSRLPRIALVTGALLACAPGPARGQNLGQDADRLEGRRRATTAAHAALVSARARWAADSARRGQLGPLRTYAGLTMLGDSAQLGASFLQLMDSAFAIVLAEGRTMFGASADSLLAGQTLTASPTGMRFPGAPRTHHRLNVQLQTYGPLGTGFALESGDRPTRAGLEGHFARWFAAGAGRRISDAMKSWSRPVILLRGDTDARTNADAYGAMAFQEYRREGMTVARSCLDGVIAACRTALGLVANGDTIGAWTDAETRRRLAATVTSRHPTIDVAAARGACLRGSDSACRTVLRFRAYMSPTSTESRLALIRQALVAGGPSAFERLARSANEPIGRQLELAAGIPLDSLIANWRARIVAARPRSGAPSGAELFSVLFTSVVVVGLAASRRPL